MNVSARISDGLARRVAMSQAIRRVMTWVLPVPAPATTSSGPSPWVTARSCSGLSPPSSASRPAGGSPSMTVGASGRSRPRQAAGRAGRLPAGPGPSHGICGESGATVVEAMAGIRLLLVTACLSDRDPGSCGGPAWRLGKRKTKGLGLLGRERGIGLTRDDRLRVEPRSRSGVEAADHEAVAVAVGERQGEALVAARLLERIEPYETNPLNRPTRIRLEDRRARRQLVQLAGDRQDLVEVSVEDCLEAAALRAPRDTVEPAPQARLATRLDSDDDEKEQNDDEKADDDGAEIGGDESVQIDRTVLPAGVGSGLLGGAESSRCHAPRTGIAADAILRGFHRSSPRRHLQPMAKRSRTGGRPASVGPCSEPPRDPRGPDRPARQDR